MQGEASVLRGSSLEIGQQPVQLEVIERGGSAAAPGPLPPQTRYQGSKLKLLPWIWDCLSPLDFESALDAFGGSGCVSHWLKAHGKGVTYNDVLLSNYMTGLALVENDTVTLASPEVDALLEPAPGRSYNDFIERTFHEVFFLDEENAWLDRVTQNISRLEDKRKQAVAFYALFQACLVKRPYNLFHRANLYMRTAEVPRSFGNKTTWDTPFESHFRRFVRDANGAIFKGLYPAAARCGDAGAVEGRFDLVYIDPPYMNSRGVGTNYYDYYHFLDGLCRYEEWETLINHRKRHRPISYAPSNWLSKKSIRDAFNSLFERFADSVLVISYRSDGIPSVDELIHDLRRYKRNVEVHQRGKYKYVLSTNGRSEEVLVVGR